MKYYIVAKVMSYRQADRVRKLIPQLKVDIITIKEDKDKEILKKENEHPILRYDSLWEKPD